MSFESITYALEDVLCEECPNLDHCAKQKPHCTAFFVIRYFRNIVDLGKLKELIAELKSL